MEQSEQEILSPNKALAKLICRKLASNGLIPESKQEAVLRKLETGTAKQDDWRLWVEVAIEEQDKKEGEENV